MTHTSGTRAGIAIFLSALVVALPAAAAQDANTDPAAERDANTTVKTGGFCNGVVDWDCYELVCNGDDCVWTECQIWIAVCILG